jgi:hypothetical protein
MEGIDLEKLEYLWLAPDPDDTRQKNAATCQRMVLLRKHYLRTVSNSTGTPLYHSIFFRDKKEGFSFTFSSPLSLVDSQSLSVVKQKKTEGMNHHDRFSSKEILRNEASVEGSSNEENHNLTNPIKILPSNR